tara:strand:+ start:165 stop:566 length:402 start_codon:yes stop_codon:yes gene_type:complete
MKNEKNAQKIPAKTTVVNLGVSGFHLIVTVYNANPVADTKPIIAPNAVPEILSFIIMIHTPAKAITIAIKVDFLRISPKIKYPTIAAMKGIAANIKRVTAAEVIVIEKINPVNAVAKNMPPRIDDIPIFRKFL